MMLKTFMGVYGWADSHIHILRNAVYVSCCECTWDYQLLCKRNATWSLVSAKENRSAGGAGINR